MTAQIEGLPIKAARLGRGMCLILALIYATVLVSLPIDIFKDRQNYLSYAGNSTDILKGYEKISPAFIVANEPLWIFSNIGLSKVFNPPTIVRLFIFFPAALTAFLLLRISGSWWMFMLLLLLTPQLIQNFITHIRQGVAISVFLTGYNAKKWGRLLMLTTPFIHISFAFVLMIQWITTAMVRLRLGADIRAIVNLIAAVTIGLFLGTIAAALGARQAKEYDFVMANVSGLGFVFWVGVLALFFWDGRRFMREHALATSALVFYLGTYFLMEVTGRVYESILPLVLIAGINLGNIRRYFFALATLVWLGLQWVLILSGATPIFTK
jgi:hypothetical protein